MKIELQDKVEALKKIILHIEEVKDQVKQKIEQLKKKIKNIPKKNPFDLTDNVKNQNEGDEIDLGLFLDLAEENKIIYNQTPVNTLIEGMKKPRKGFLRMIMLVWAMKKGSILTDFLKIVMN